MSHAAHGDGESMLTSTKRRKGKIEKNVSISGGQREQRGHPPVHHSAHFYNEPLTQMLRDFFFFFPSERHPAYMILLKHLTTS